MMEAATVGACDAFLAALRAADAVSPTLPLPPQRLDSGRLLGASPAPYRGAFPRPGRDSEPRVQPFRGPNGTRKSSPDPAVVAATVARIGEARKAPGENALRLRRLRATAAEIHPWDSHRGEASRVFQCGTVVIGGGADGADAYIGQGKNGSHGIFGTQSCGLLWECACCRARAGGEHLAEIRAVVAHWLDKSRPNNRAYFLTLTTRHDAGDDVETMRRGLARAWGAFVEGRAWQRFKVTHGAHYVRALDATVGKSGFHLHFHVVLFTSASLRTHEVKTEFGERWRRMVTRHMGPKHVPTRARGVRMTKVRGVEAVARYVGKLGLELAADHAKKAKGASRTPWQVLEEVAALRDAAKAAQGDDRRQLFRSAFRRQRTWTAWVDGMRGARWITWSVGLRELCGLGPERSDEQLVADAALLDEQAASVKARIPNQLRKRILYDRRFVDTLLGAADLDLPLLPFVEAKLGAVEAAIWEAANDPERLKQWARERAEAKAAKARKLTQDTA